ncbi:hypothetical protein D3C77_563380 [compost metagenome]
MCIQILSQALIHHQLQQAAVVMRHQVGDRMLHAVEQDVVQARLVHHAVGELGQPQACIRHLVGALDLLRILGIRLPEGVLVQLVGFLLQQCAAVEALHDFHGAAGNTICLTKQHRPGFLLDDAGLDIGKVRQLPRQRQTRRATADDQHIDLFRQIDHRRRRCRHPRFITNLIVAGLETVQMVLHEQNPLVVVVG